MALPVTPEAIFHGTIETVLQWWLPIHLQLGMHAQMLDTELEVSVKLESAYPHCRQGGFRDSPQV